MRTPHLLTVTREMAQDQLYGLGKSILPIHHELRQLGWQVTYFCQTHLDEVQLGAKLDWIKRVQSLFGARHFNTSALIAAVVERLYVGHLAAGFQIQHDCTHVHFHDPWLAWGYVLSQWMRGLKSARALGRLKAAPSHAQVPLFLTEHGFGAYAEAVRSDGVTIGPRWLWALKKLELWICHRMTWVMAPTQLALNQLGMDLGVRGVQCQALGKKTTPNACTDSVLDSNAGIPSPSKGFPLNWVKVSHALPAVQRMDRTLARERLQLSPSQKVLLTVGRLAPLKQFDVIVDVFADVCTQWGDWQLIILGGGDDTALRAQVQRLGLERQVTFATTQEVDLYYSAADVYVSASLTESFGLANLEALAHGLPSLCSNVGGVPEVVQDAAVLFEPTREALFLALQSFLQDPLRPASLCLAAAKLCARWPTLDQITHTYVQLYCAPLRSDGAAFSG